jgi:NAD(P)H-dependent FMN reductase
MSTAKILAFAGSTRKESFNRRALSFAVRGAEAAGANVMKIELADYQLPLFDQDLEASSGLPDAARRLKELFLAHDGLLLACPEYNSSITPLLKNTIDWVSRPAPGEASLAAFRGKVAGLVSASPGALGGLRGLRHVREILGNVGVLVIPQQTAVSQAMSAFAADGSLKDAQQQTAIEGVGRALAELIAKINSPPA